MMHREGAVKTEHSDVEQGAEEARSAGEPTSREEGFRRALRLEYLTVGYNVVEAVASVLAGRAAGSISLVGFGLDSVVESLSGLVLIWRLRKHGAEAEEEERMERRATRFVGVTFLVLGVYVLAESIRKIILQEKPEPSPFGIAIASLSAIVMPILARQKLHLGQALGLRSLVADSKETFVCMWLSLALLLGLLTNSLFGFWLSDPLVGLLIVAYLAKEGIELVLGEED
ncbi:MAG: cation transporter [candidate division KSB1 bacterium]|nr:cation transporter [candidate division KSB1 bacterium]